VIKQLVPPRPPVVRGQCCVPTDETTERLQAWREKRYGGTSDPNRCQRRVRYEIDGQGYCAIHAGNVALRKWLAGELVEKEPGTDYGQACFDE
jgi:hypothetical protein